MSASYIRELVRQWAQQAAVAQAVPFYDTINKSEDPSDSIWFTVEFNSLSHEGHFCEKNYFEQGYIDVVFISEPGTGDLPAVQAAEKVVPMIMGFSDPNDRLSLESYEPIAEYSQGSADSSYRVGVQVNYRYAIK